MKIAAICFGACCILLLTSCSDKLSKREAAKIIQERIKFPVAEDVPIKYGLVSYDEDSLPDFYYVLQQKEIFSITNLGRQTEAVFSPQYQYRVTLHEKAKNYITTEDTSPVKSADSTELTYTSYFKICDTQFDEVKEIVEIPALNTAEIAFQIRRTKFTPFWEYYLKKNGKGDTFQLKSFIVIKTSDGWKAYK